MKHLLPAVLIAAAAAGCAVPQRPQPVYSAAEAADRYTPPECDGAEACAQMWRAAQAWVATNSGFKLQVVTDAVLETYNPPPYSQRWAYRVVREQAGGTKERLIVTPSCGQAPVCRESADDMRANFNRAIRLPR